MRRKLAFLLLLAVLVAGCTTSKSDIDQWVRGDEEAWNSHDLDKILSLYSDDCIYEDVATQKINRGKDQIRAFIADMFRDFPDLKIETKSYFISSDYVCAEFVWSGTYMGEMPGLPPGNGKSVSIRGVHIVELRGLKAISIKDYWDMSSMMQQLGFLPSTPEQSSEKETDL